MTSKIDISVLLPVYNVAPYIEQSLRSLFTQTKTDGVEFIIVNDATPDNSIEIARNIAEEYPNLNIKFVDHSKNRGLCAARKSGVEAATGKYIVFIDSDDWCDTQLLETMFNTIESRGDDILCCDFMGCYNDGRQKYSIQRVDSKDGNECARLVLQDKVHAYLWNKMFKRSLFELDKMTFLENLNMWEDALICTQLFSLADKVSYLNKGFVFYRRSSSGSITGSVSTKNRHDQLRVIDALEGFSKKNNKDFSDLLAYKKLQACYRMYLMFNKKELAEFDDFLILNTNNIWSTPYLSFTRKSVVWMGKNKMFGTLGFIRKVLKTIKRKK